MATKTRELADFILEEGIGGDADIAIQSKKPTRAVVSSKDLTTDSRERSIRNNNNRI